MTATCLLIVFWYLVQVGLLLDIEWGSEPRRIVSRSDREIWQCDFTWEEPENYCQLVWRWAWPFVIGLIPLWAIWRSAAIYLSQPVRKKELGL